MKNIAGTYNSEKFIMREKKLLTGIPCEKVNALLLDGASKLYAGGQTRLVRP